MWALVAAWLAFPLVLLAVMLGLGLLVERASGGRVAGALVAPLGLAALVAVSQLLTWQGATAPLTAPVCAALAAVGWALGWRRVRAARLDRWALAAALGVFGVFAAPVVLSGSATFAGYGLLGDTSIHFVSIDRLLTEGRSFAGLPPSSYQGSLRNYIGAGYPFGAQTALGAARPLLGQDVAWVYQPFLAALGAMLSLSLLVLASPLAGRQARAVVAFLAAQPALVYAFALQGSIKELATAWVVTLLAALVPDLVARRGQVRAVVPLAVAASAAYAVIGAAVAPWLGPILLVAALAVLGPSPRAPRRGALQVAAFAALAALLSLPTISASANYFRVAGKVVTSSLELGNLLGPLHQLQGVGIWLAGDYRTLPQYPLATDVLIGVALAAAALGLVWALRGRAWWILVYVATSVLACAYVLRAGSPWAQGKALMIVSPAVMLAAALGALALGAWWRREAGIVVLAALAVGVLASNALAYHDVSLAPRARLAELQRLGPRLAGRGPTLTTEWEEYAKHFLRRGDPTAVAETAGPRLATSRSDFPLDLDRVPLGYLDRYRSLVLRRSPVASRPPASYRLVGATAHYELWRREGGSVRVHLALGGALTPGARAPCAQIAALARSARSGEDLFAAPADATPTWVPATGVLPTRWRRNGDDRLFVSVYGPGRVQGKVHLRSGGRWEIWLSGSLNRPLAVLLDGRRVATAPTGLDGYDEYQPAVAATLPPGDHHVELIRGVGGVAPGVGDVGRVLGPVVFARSDEDRPVTVTPPARWRSLCGRRLDWIELGRVDR